MVHVYNCHPYASQQIVQVEQEPGLVCCGGGALFVVTIGGCKVEAYNLDQEGCPLICRFATMGNVRSILHSNIGDYLVTIEEKNSATYLRAYTNWRYQAEEKARVGVRLLGHLLRGASQRGGVQMEIIEIPLSERPVAVACCPVTGDLLVGCDKTLVLFTLRRQNHPNMSQHNIQAPSNTQQSSSQNPDQTSNHNFLDFERSVILHLPATKPVQVALCAGYVAVQTDLEVLVLKLEANYKQNELELEESSEEPKDDVTEDQADFLILPRHQELLGERAKDCDIPVSIEKAGLEERGQNTFSYVLFRRFTPDYLQGCSVEETHLHSLKLQPLFTSCQSPVEEPTCVFCFFSLPTTGYLYSLKGGVELISIYQYPEKVLEAVLTDHLLHVITQNALQCFTVRCAAVAARFEDPYIDTTMRACPPSSLEVCALRMQLFIGLRSLCVCGCHVILLSTADTETPEETERNAQRRGLGNQRHCHQALPYYRMSGLAVTEVMARNRPLSRTSHTYGPGFLFYLKHYLLEETDQHLSQEAADEVIDILSQSEPSQLISVCASPTMKNVNPTRTLRILQHLEDSAGVSVAMTITMATLLLRLDDLPQYTQLMERHAEMVFVYGFIEEPRLLLHGGGGGQHTNICPTALTRQMAKSQPGLLVAAMVGLHENNKVQLEQVDHMFQVLGCENSLQVDFWEAMLMASSQEAVIQELLFRLSSVYIDRLMHTSTDKHVPAPPARKSLKSADDLINSCSHYGALYPWLTVLCPPYSTGFQHQEALHKMQSLLCGPSLSVGSVTPLLESLSDKTLWGFSLHLLCATRKGQYDTSIEELLDQCPQAIIAYANHHLQDEYMDLWWQKLLPELCNRTRSASDNSILLAALKETLVVVAMETSPTQFLELIPDDGTASYFLPHLLTCSQKHLLA
ncbi:Hermansky-Pudlak syndrome 3 protein isoform X4 [Corythoichthys intestinalis]|uniref:Hermansky-Pudlak syndrome 3 protein isoform X4 n=1 Tax=Corythoichthys intestinalis TaxID=161448 RepID=UPI0025A58358|nr:Hermansky-Pudlak syndrome 3 protein isoform X4 [Corythoichthys intestinalis]